VQRSKTAPKGTVQFIATCLAQSPNLPADYQAHQVLGDFLHLGDTPFKEACCDLPEGSDHRAQVLILGLLLAALEGP
jgi:ParB family chromosome partitioning protein